MTKEVIPRWLRAPKKVRTKRGEAAARRVDHIAKIRSMSDEMVFDPVLKKRVKVPEGTPKKVRTEEDREFTRHRNMVWDAMQTDRRIYPMYRSKKRGFDLYSYLSTYPLNHVYTHEKWDEAMSYVARQLPKDFSVIMRDRREGLIEMIFRPILTHLKADLDSEMEAFLNYWHEDILQETLIKLNDQKDAYVPTKRSSLFTFVVNAIPNIYIGLHRDIWRKEQNGKEKSLLPSDIGDWLGQEDQDVFLEMFNQEFVPLEE